MIRGSDVSNKALAKLIGRPIPDPLRVVVGTTVYRIPYREEDAEEYIDSRFPPSERPAAWKAWEIERSNRGAEGM